MLGIVNIFNALDALRKSNKKLKKEGLTENQKAIGGG
jgi:hypothetical protein